MIQVLKPGLVKGQWSPQEDAKLMMLVGRVVIPLIHPQGQALKIRKMLGLDTDTLYFFINKGSRRIQELGAVGPKDGR